jgi:hypothetical protein
VIKKNREYCNEIFPLKNSKFCTKKENTGRNSSVEIARFGCRVSTESAFDGVGLGWCYYNYMKEQGIVGVERFRC